MPGLTQPRVRRITRGHPDGNSLLYCRPQTRDLLDNSYAFACNRCRSRKSRCDGERPSCRRCVRSNETCQYPHHSAHTEEQLRDAQARINELEGALAERSSQADLSPALGMSGSQTMSTEFEPGSTMLPVTRNDEAISPHVGLDESGHVTYHGPTSRFYASSLVELSSASAEALRTRLYQTHAPALESNLEMLHHVWQPLLQTKTEDELGMPPKLAQDLLNIYWVWQYPLHNCVYKPCKCSSPNMLMYADVERVSSWTWRSVAHTSPNSSYTAYAL